MDTINDLLTKISKKSEILSQFNYERNDEVKNRLCALKACDFIFQFLIENRYTLFDECKEITLRYQDIPECTDKLEYVILYEFIKMQKDVKIRWVPVESVFKFSLTE